MRLETERLVLRHWRLSDAENLFKYASDPEIGTAAGWKPHKTAEESRSIIKDVLSAPYTFAVCLKENGEAIGSIGLMIGSEANIKISSDEAELGYWIGRPFWGRGLIPEAAKVLIDYGFNELDLKRIWCGYFEGNEKSKRAQEKCGFVYSYTLKDFLWELTGEIKTEHITCLEKSEL